jgi:hypothetical protein
VHRSAHDDGFELKRDVPWLAERDCALNAVFVALNATRAGGNNGPIFSELIYPMQLNGTGAVGAPAPVSRIASHVLAAPALGPPSEHGTPQKSAAKRRKRDSSKEIANGPATNGNKIAAKPSRVCYNFSCHVTVGP